MLDVFAGSSLTDLSMSNWYIRAHSLVGLKGTWDQTLSSGSFLVTFMTIHFSSSDSPILSISTPKQVYHCDFLQDYYQTRSCVVWIRFLRTGKAYVITIIRFFQEVSLLSEEDPVSEVVFRFDFGHVHHHLNLPVRLRRH